MRVTTLDYFEDFDWGSFCDEAVALSDDENSGIVLFTIIHPDDLSTASGVLPMFPHELPGDSSYRHMKELFSMYGGERIISFSVTKLPVKKGDTLGLSKLESEVDYSKFALLPAAVRFAPDLEPVRQLPPSKYVVAPL